MIENRHIPNLIIAKKNGQKCIKIWKSGIRSSDCNSDCGTKKFGDNISFCEWLFEQTDYMLVAFFFTVLKVHVFQAFLNA
jgi:hypothetical protein